MLRDDMLDRLVDYERGNLEEDEQVYDLFQKLIDTGLAWTLQGSYGRMAAELIKQGHCIAGNAAVGRGKTLTKGYRDE